MATEIERQLYGTRGVHGVSEFTVLPGVVRLHLLPWEGPQIYTIATFRQARLMSVETYPINPDDLDLPWDVIGFDCYDLGENRWKFVLHCDGIEWCFESVWPFIERANPQIP